jgi:hypothetical protein
MQREGFNQTIQMMTIQHQQAAAMNNPVFLLSLFKEGLQLGTNLGGDDDPLSMALRTGVAGLGQIKDMMALQAGMTRPKLSAGKTAKVANPSRKPGEKPPLSLTRQELLDLARLKKLAAAKGEDFHGMVKAAAAVLGKPAGDDDPEEDEEDGDEETAPDDGAGHRADS